MPKEILLSEHSKATLTLHHLSAKKEESLILWLSELVSHKKYKIEDNALKIEDIQQLIKTLNTDISNIEEHVQQVLQTTKNSLNNILREIINETGIGPNTRLNLTFENGEPKILALD